MTENFDRQAWDTLVARAVADDPILTALDMGVLEGMSTEQVDLFFRTVLSATPTDEELLEQSRTETERRMRAQFDAADSRTVRETEAGVGHLSTFQHGEKTILTPNPALRAKGQTVSAHPWSDPWENSDDLVAKYAAGVRAVSAVLVILALTILACGILVGLSA